MGSSLRLRNGIIALTLTAIASLAWPQGMATVEAGKSPNTLTCSPAPCVLPNVQVDTLTYGSEPRALVLKSQ